MFDIQSVSSKVYAECVLRFSDVLDGTFLTFNQVNHVPGSTISGGFDTKPFTSSRAAKLSAGLDMCTHLAAWSLTLAVSSVGFFFRFISRPY